MAESRNEHFLEHCIEGSECEREPKSRMEKLLKELIETTKESGNSEGGVSIYTPIREE